MHEITTVNNMIHVCCKQLLEMSAVVPSKAELSNFDNKPSIDIDFSMSTSKCKLLMIPSSNLQRMILAFQQMKYYQDCHPSLEIST